MNNFLSINDVNDPLALAQEALNFKKDPIQHERHKGKKVGFVFFNPSLRTRLSSQLAAQNLGADAVVLNIGKDGWALEFEEEVIMNGDKPEHIKEAAGVLGRYFDVIGIRTFPSLTSQEDDYQEKMIQAFRDHSKKPILSLESATVHPLQSLADLVTIKEHWKETRKPKVVLSWAPHVKALPQAVANSFSQWMNAADVDFSIAHPEGYELSSAYVGDAEVHYNQKKALADADFVYVKNWSSYTSYGQVLSQDPSWTISMDHLKVTNQAKVMHCLPVRRGVVIQDEVLDSSNAIHLEQAENRVYAAQAVLNRLLKTAH